MVFASQRKICRKLLASAIFRDSVRGAIFANESQNENKTYEPSKQPSEELSFWRQIVVLHTEGLYIANKSSNRSW